MLSTPDAKDVRSYARPLIARVTHVDLDLAADFTTKTVSGQAAMDVLAAPGAQDIVLDTLGLKITKVTDGGGRDLPWKLGSADADLGAPLTVRLNGAKRIGRTLPCTPTEITKLEEDLMPLLSSLYVSRKERERILQEFDKLRTRSRQDEGRRALTGNRL